MRGAVFRAVAEGGLEVLRDLRNRNNGPCEECDSRCVVLRMRSLVHGAPVIYERQTLLHVPVEKWLQRADPCHSMTAHVCRFLSRSR
jgi:hypothetical protein